MAGTAARGYFYSLVLSRKKSIVFLGSKPIGYACLQHLIGIQESLSVQITGILTQKRNEFGGESDLMALSLRNNIPVLSSLEELPECDIICSVQYHEILKQHHIDKARQIAVNLHMAPLPEYRGSNQFSFAILEEKEEFGTTIHRIGTRIDQGDILFEKRFPIPADCWVSNLYSMTESASLALFKESLPRIVTGDYVLTSQQSFEGIRSTSLHFRKEMTALKQIDLAWDAEKIARHIRATAMPGFEPAFTMIGDRKVYFTPQQDEPA